MDTKQYGIKEILEALADEVKYNGHGSDLTLDILREYEGDYSFIEECFTVLAGEE